MQNGQLTLPEPQMSYPLPGGGVAYSEQEWYEKVAEAQAHLLAKVYAWKHANELGGQSMVTRAVNTIAPYQLWLTQVGSDGTLAGLINEYNAWAAKAKAEEEAKAKAEKEANPPKKRGRKPGNGASTGQEEQTNQQAQTGSTAPPETPAAPPPLGMPPSMPTA